MKNLFTILFLFIISTGFGQLVIQKASLSSGGGSATSGNLHIVYALGEIGVQEVDNSSLHLSEGFVGPDIAKVVGIEDYGVLEGLTVYPNPVKNYVNLQFPADNDYEIHIFDLTGKEVFQQVSESNSEAQYQLSNLKAGVYLLVVIDRTQQLSATVKLQKM